MGEVRNFRDDDFLKPHLEKMGRGELSKLVRKLLRAYFSGEIRLEERITLVQSSVSGSNFDAEDGKDVKDTPAEQKIEMNFDMFE